MEEKKKAYKSKFDKLQDLVTPQLRQNWAQIQTKLREKQILTNEVDFEIDEEGNCVDLKFVGAVDISVQKDDDMKACAAYVICSYPSLKILYSDLVNFTHTQPYVPGFLAFREVPVLKDMIEKQRKNKPEITPQVVLVDGNGLFHSRSFGFACQLGVECNLPTIGVGKTVFAVDGLNKKNVRLISNDYLYHPLDAIELIGCSGKVWGAAFKSTEKTINPLIVSQGHRLSLHWCIEVVRACVRHIRMPIPIDIADKMSRDAIRERKYKENE